MVDCLGHFKNKFFLWLRAVLTATSTAVSPDLPPCLFFHSLINGLYEGTRKGGSACPAFACGPDSGEGQRI